MSVVFAVQGNKVAQRLVKEGIKAGGVWYRVEPCVNEGPDSRSQYCCGRCPIDSKCSGKPACGYCSGLHHTSTHKCNVVGCIANQGSLCGHTHEKCPNCKINHIAFSSRCTKKAEATGEAPDRRRREPAGLTTQTTGPTSGGKRTALGCMGSAQDGGESAGCEEEMVDAEEGGVEAENVTRAESRLPMTRAMPAPTTMGTATTAGTGTQLEMKLELLPPMFRVIQQNCARSYVWTMAALRTWVERKSDAVCQQEPP